MTRLRPYLVVAHIVHAPHRRRRRRPRRRTVSAAAVVVIVVRARPAGPLKTRTRTEIRAQLINSLLPNAHTDARTGFVGTQRRSSAYFHNPPCASMTYRQGECSYRREDSVRWNKTSVQCLFSIPPCQEPVQGAVSEVRVGVFSQLNVVVRDALYLRLDVAAQLEFESKV